MANLSRLRLLLDVADSDQAHVTFLEALIVMAMYPTLLKLSRSCCMMVTMPNSLQWDLSSSLMCKHVDPSLFTGVKSSPLSIHHDYGLAKAERA